MPDAEAPVPEPEYEPSARDRACGKLVLEDWYRDGVARGHYRRSCWAAALGMLPSPGALDYSTVHEDLRRDYRRDAARWIASRRQVSD